MIAPKNQTIQFIQREFLFFNDNCHLSKIIKIHSIVESLITSVDFSQAPAITPLNIKKNWEKKKSFWNSCTRSADQRNKIWLQGYLIVWFRWYSSCSTFGFLSNHLYQGVNSLFVSLNSDVIWQESSSPIVSDCAYLWEDSPVVILSLFIPLRKYRENLLHKLLSYYSFNHKLPK